MFAKFPKILILFAGLIFQVNTNLVHAQVDVNLEVDKMLEAVGGRDVWANSHGFIMYEMLYSTSFELPVYRTYWVDFKSPRIMEYAKGQGFEVQQALNIDHGWMDRNGKVSDWEAEKVQGFGQFWRGIPTRVFHMLAARDPSIEAKWRDGVIDIFHKGEWVVWIATNPEGVPVAYGREDRHTETHFLGKHMAYGNVSLWSEATEPGGQWRVVMLDYELLSEPHETSFEKAVE